LLQAAKEGDSKQLREALAQLADHEISVTEFSDDQGRTPLHVASAYGREAIVRELLLVGFPYNLLDANKRTAAEYAQEAGHNDIYELLIEEGMRCELVLSALRANEQGDERETANAAYLQQPLRYEDGKLLDAESNGVMMGWEGPLMRMHADVLCPTTGLDVLNVGFGLGLIDEELQRHAPKTHTIIEAHPDVYAHMLQLGWDKRPGVRILFGRWQDVLDQLVAYDAIFFDTFGEYYEDLREFHEHVPNLLRQTGIYSFFNGLAATNPFFHDLYCRIAAVDLLDMGLHTEYRTVPMDVKAEEWEGVKGKYWTLNTYNLPICRFS